MSEQELMELRLLDEAPFDHREYTIWLHEKIITKIKYDIWKFREDKSIKLNGYAACNHIMNLPSIKSYNEK